MKLDAEESHYNVMLSDKEGSPWNNIWKMSYTASQWLCEHVYKYKDLAHARLYDSFGEQI
jgi:hypothetical protein